MAKKPSKARVPTDDDLPDEHVPKELQQEPPPRKRTYVEYACGYETIWKGDRPRAEYAMWAGPFPMLEMALNKQPSRDSIISAAKRQTAVIIRFNLDGTDEVLYRWKESMTDPGKWVREKKAK